MAQGINYSPLKRFVEGIAGDPSPEVILWQVGVATVAILLGFFTARLVCRQVRPSARWRFGAGDFERVAYPLFALFFVFAGRLVLQQFQRAALMEIVQTLIVAWVAIRIAVYILGHVLPEGGFLRASIKTIAWIAWIGVALHLTGLLPEVIVALDGVGISVGKDKVRITLWLVMQALAALALTLTLAAWVSRVSESRILAADAVEMSTRVVISKLVRVATMFLAIMVALPLVGIDITALSIFSGALGVGLGFGLQKIASNYVSGFIVLLDRSLRIGDLITVDGRKGKVMAIESRYTVIQGGDGTESIIPNDKMITESVYHHTFTDPRAAVKVAVSVAYDSNVEKALELLAQAAAAHPRVIATPAPVSRIAQLNESGIDLEVVCWIADAGEGDADLKSDLFRAVLAAFGKAAIEIPYPRRDMCILATAETVENHIKSLA